jgi:hypothetical protein
MPTQTLTKIQRRLVVTGGPLAQQAGARLQEFLARRPGPSTAIGVLNIDVEAIAGSGWEQELVALLTTISPVDLAHKLARQGWLLDTAEIGVALALDTAVCNADLARQLAARIAESVQRCVGVDAAILLLWLAEEPHTPAAAACVTATQPEIQRFGRGVLVISPLNANGLRLADREAFVATGADLLWALTATPLYAAPDEWLNADAMAPPGLSAPGIACWNWSAAHTRQAFEEHWLRGVLEAWRADPQSPVTVDEVGAWITEQKHTASEVLNALEAAAPALAPRAAPTAWEAPLPWRIHDMLWRMQVDEAVAEEAADDPALQIGWRLGAWLDEAEARLHTALKTVLDTSPCGGPARAAAWAALLAQTYDADYGGLRRQAERLAAASGDAELEWESAQQTAARLLAAWPLPAVASWAAALARVWRWPDLAWRYWQLRRQGRLLCELLHRRRAYRRRKWLLDAAGEGLRALQIAARRLAGQAEEIGEMLHYLLNQVGSPLLDGPNRPLVADDPASVPWELYMRFVDTDAGEADWAAQAIGGLGHHLRKLDDAILETLRELAGQRLAGVATLTAIDALAALHPSEAALQTWWEGMWAKAAPLWPADALRLSNAAHAGQGAQAWIAAAHAARLRDLLADTDPTRHWLEAPDREHILLLRLLGSAATQSIPEFEGDSAQ